jgi:two-component system invasion response regulator UvrY
MNILLVDGQPIVRTALTGLLKASATFTVCGEAGDVFSAQRLTEKLQPDCTILDIILGGRDGIELVKNLKDIHPTGKILIFSSQDERIYARRAIEAGAHGYVMKKIEIEQFHEALETIGRGEYYVSEILQKAFIQELFGQKRNRDKSSLEALSDRELQILRLLGMGFSSAQIARELSLSIKTIGTYRERLKDKLNLDTATELESYAKSFVYANYE